MTNADLGGIDKLFEIMECEGPADETVGMEIDRGVVGFGGPLGPELTLLVLDAPLKKEEELEGKAIAAGIEVTEDVVVPGAMAMGMPEEPEEVVMPDGMAMAAGIPEDDEGPLEGGVIPEEMAKAAGMEETAPAGGKAIAVGIPVDPEDTLEDPEGKAMAVGTPLAP